MTQTFEEKFPELGNCYSRNTDMVFVHDIDRFCLSKQRVREAIERKIEENNLRNSNWNLKMMQLAIYQGLIKELGLDREDNLKNSNSKLKIGGKAL